MNRLFTRINLVLVIGILVFANLVATNLVWKVDLTRTDAYSLSRVTRETLSRVEDPLRIRVFYNDSVPAPYNAVRQYLVDLLQEFQAVDRERILVELEDMETPDARQEAARLGLQQVEIQEIRSDEFQSRAVYTGAVVLYGNVAEPVDRILSAEGLEYRLTQAVRSAVTQVDSLSGTTEPVVMRVFASPTLREIGIRGFDELERDMRALHERVNADNYGRVEYEFVEPADDAELARLTEEFSLTPIRWQSPLGEERVGLLEITLSLGERVQRVPLEVFQTLFGGYTLAAPEEIEDAVRAGLRSLVATNPRIAYSIGAGEKQLGDPQFGAAPFAQLASERYELIPVDLDEQPVPAGIDTLVINGPTASYGEAALYRIDQFLMNGGSVLAFVDRWVQEIPTQQQMMQGAQPQWREQSSGLEDLLEHYGVLVTSELVLDEESFVSRQANQSQQIFQAPVLQGGSVNRDHPITAGLENVVVLNATEIRRTLQDDPAEVAGEDEGGGRAATDVDASDAFVTLLESSPRSWSVERPEMAGPWIEGAPADGDVGRRTLALLRRGSLASYFDEPPAGVLPVTDDAEGAVSAAGDGPATDIGLERHRTTSRGDAQLLVVSSSALTTPQLLDPRQRTPNGTLLMNALDVLGGSPAMARLRSKGLGVPTIEVASATAPQLVRLINIGLVPALVVALGLIAWARRRSRARAIQRRFITASEEG